MKFSVINNRSDLSNDMKTESSNVSGKNSENSLCLETDKYGYKIIKLI